MIIEINAISNKPPNRIEAEVNFIIRIVDRAVKRRGNAGRAIGCDRAREAEVRDLLSRQIGHVHLLRGESARMEPLSCDDGQRRPRNAYAAVRFAESPASDQFSTPSSKPTDD
jgi:hypothetical protein